MTPSFTQSIVAWVMVLIRKRYFVQHLESIKRREHTRTIIKNKVSGWVKHDDTITINVKGPSAANTLVDSNTRNHFSPSDGIGAALVGGGSAGIGLSLAISSLPAAEDEGNAHLPSIAQSPQSGSFEFVHPNEAIHGVVADANSFTSSPRSGVLQLPTSPMSQPEGKTPYSVAFSPRPQIRHRRNVPIPRRQTAIQPPIMESAPNAQSLGQRGKDQGLGGFPGPIQLFHRITRTYFPRVHRWAFNILSQPIETAKKGKTLQWLSDEFSSKLVILRNSDFDTEELDDEELERLGGIEYVPSIIESG